jgi:hypothetical protein
MSSNKDRAEHVAYNAHAKTADMILLLGQEHLKAQQAGSIALDNRGTQVAAIQMTAIALCLAFIASDKATQVAAILTGIAALMFACGTAAAFHMVMSGYQKLPGVPPSWWYREGTNTTPLRTVRCWASGQTQEAIDYNNGVNEHKGDTLNRSITLAAAGVIFTLLAVIAQFF